jgi:hypothetical protein
VRAKIHAHSRGAAVELLLAAVFATILSPLARAQESQPSTAPPSAALTLPRGKRLILKNGSDQLVRSYEVQGDRVRYYSVERSDWEEIPTDLVDWDATRKAEAARAEQQQALVEKVRAAEAARKAEPLDVDASIEAAPGVFLPPGEGLFVFDGKAVLPLTQAEAGLKLDKGQLLKQVLVPIPIVPSRRNVQLPGKQAKFRIKNTQPEFYMRTADAREPEMELVRARVHGDLRQIESLDTLFKQQVSNRKTLPLQRWTIVKGVYRFTLAQPLEPGEYAFAEIVKGEGLNLYVWDFGVDPPAAKSPSK